MHKALLLLLFQRERGLGSLLLYQASAFVLMDYHYDMYIFEETGKAVGRVTKGLLVILSCEDIYPFCDDVIRTYDFEEVHFVHRNGDIFKSTKEKLFDANKDEEGYRQIKIRELEQL